MKWFLILAIPGTLMQLSGEGRDWERVARLDTLDECRAAALAQSDPRLPFCIESTSDGQFVDGMPVTVVAVRK